MKKSIIPVAMAIVAMLSLHSIAQEVATDTLPDFDSKMATVQFMNYMNYVVYTLSSYQNVFVIEEEYRNLSPGNLNLNRIPDEQVLNAIEKMLDTIHSMRVDEKQRDWFFERQKVEAQRARHDIFVNAATGLAGKAVEHGDEWSDAGKNIANALKVIGKDGFKDGFKAALLGSNPAGWAVIAADTVSTAASAYGEYVKLQRKIEDESAEYKFKYDLNKDAQLHEQNKYQLRLQYDLTKEYGINDAYRLSGENAEALVAVVKSEDHTGAFKRMKLMLAGQKAYENFPMFWRYYAAFALEAKEAQTALNAYNHFREINRHSLFRHDRMAADTAMAGVAAITALGNPDKEAVREALEMIRAYNYDSFDVDMAFFCASTYYSILGDCKNALEILDGLVAVLEDRARNSLRKYRDIFDPGKPDAPWAEPPAVTDLFRCRMLRKAVMESEKDGSFRSDLEQILERSTTASIEKLFFVGDVRIRDLWAKAKQDVEAIRLQYEKHTTKNCLTALVPISWFALGDFPIRVDLMRGTNVVGNIEETFKKRKIAFNRPECNLVFAKIEMKCPSQLLRGVDGIILQIPNKSWPVAIRLEPSAGVDIQNAEFDKDETRYVPVSVDFLGERFELQEMAADSSKTSSDNGDEGWSFMRGVEAWYSHGLTELWRAYDKGRTVNDYSVAFPFSSQSVDLLTNDLISAVCNGADLSLAWTNSTSHAGTLELTASFFNRFGAKYCEIDAKEEIAAGSAGTTTFPWPDSLAESQNPDVVFLSVRKTKTLEQQGKELGDKTKALGGKIGGKSKAIAGKLFKRGKKSESDEE